MTDTGPNEHSATMLRDALPKTLARSSSAWGHTLPEGTRLGEFEISGLIGEGGFGIVYMAYDHSLQRSVAIKEYMPASLAARTSGAATVSVKYEHNADMFNAGLQSFVNEARMLARFDHPALVKVHRFWEANGTAYMAMPFYEGPTLRAALAGMASPPDEAWLRQLMEPLLDAVRLLHSQNCFHRDIAPDNILLTERGPLLLDFGAARRVIGAATQALTVILKPGYAPIEQYGEVAGMNQGAWTDIYALACVMYNAITGKAPPASIERLLSDRLQPASTIAAGRYDEQLLRAIDAGLAVKPEARPQSIAAFKTLLGEPQALRTIQRAAPASAPIESKTESRAAPTATAESSVEARSLLQAKVKPRWLSTPAFALMTVLAIAGGLVWYRVQQSGPAAPLAMAPLETKIAPQTVQAIQRNPPPATVVSMPLESPAAVEAQPAPAVSAQETAVVKNVAVLPATKASIRPANNCSELLQKASLQALSTEESEYLRRECR